MTVYSLSSTGLKAIQASTDQIGRPVEHCEHGSGWWIIDAEPYGYVIANLIGQQRDGQEFDALSPFTRIYPAEGPTLTAEEVATLKALTWRYRAEQRQAAKEAQEKHDEEVRMEVARMRRLYPWAKGQVDANGKALSSGVRVAANIRYELKQAFPGIKFSVKADHNTVNIAWENGPTTAQIKAITGKYEGGYFDGMTDSYQVDKSVESEATRQVLGTVDYLFTRRNYDSNTLTLTAQGLCKLQGVEYVGMRQQIVPGSRDELIDLVYRVLGETSFPSDWMGQMTVTRKTGDYHGEWAQVVLAGPAWCV